MKKIGTILAPEKYMTGALLMNREIYNFLKNKIDISPVVPAENDFLSVKHIGTILYYFTAANEAKNFEYILGTSVATLGFLEQTKVIQQFHGVDSVGHQLVLDDYNLSAEDKKKIADKWRSFICDKNSSLTDVEVDIEVSKQAEKRCCDRSHSIIAVSPLVEKQLVDFIGADPKKIQVILNGIPDYWFESTSQEFVDKPEVVFTTRGSDSFYNMLEKGHDRAYEVLSRVDIDKKIFLHLSGVAEAKQQKYLGTIKQETGSNILLNKSREELKNNYKPGQIFLTTSRTESFNLSLAEAMACKMVPVCYPTGLVESHIVHGENGFVVNSTEEAVEIINELSKNKDLRQKIGSNAYNTAKEHFTYTRMLGEYESYLKKTTEE